MADPYFKVGDKGRVHPGTRLYPVRSKHRTWALCPNKATADLVADLLNLWKEAD